MSPAAIEVPAKASQTAQVPAVKLNNAYLDLAPIDYGMETEEKGGDGVEPAKV